MAFKPEEMSILLVDDETSILTLIGRSLRTFGYINLTMTSSGEEALEHIESESFDLVITDLVMHNVSGFQVLKKAKEKDPFIGVIIITGQGDLVHSAVKALRLGADDYLLKPWEPEEMIIRVEHVLEKQNAFRKIKLYEDCLPICCRCHKIRDDATLDENNASTWLRVDEFIITKTTAQLTHGYCPHCADAVRKESGI